MMAASPSSAAIARSRLAVAIMLLPLVAVIVVHAGCHVGPDYAMQLPIVPDVWHQELVDGEFIGETQLGDWWTRLNDPLLDELIARARPGNRDVYAALARIKQSTAQARISAAPLLPFLDSRGSFENTLLSRSAPLFIPGAFPSHPFDKWNAGLDVSWESNLFGRVSRNIEAAEAENDAAIEQYRDVMVCLNANVAKSYVTLRTLQARKRIALENVELQRQSVELAQGRVEAELVPELDVHQAELNLARTSAEIPTLEAAIQQRMNVLALLLGVFPGSLHDELSLLGPIPKPAPLSAGLPLNMVRQRPDIRGAERAVAAQTARVGVAVTDLYPRFFVGGSVFVEAQHFSDLASTDSIGYGLGPSFQWKLFNSGQVLNNIARVDAAVEEAIARYEQTMLNAFQEVETALAAYREEKLRRNELQNAAEAAAKAVQNVNDLYATGKTDFQNVLITQQSLVQTQNQLAASEGQVVINLIVLYKALGGGWREEDHHLPHSPRLGGGFAEPLMPHEDVPAERELPSPARPRTTGNAIPRDVTSTPRRHDQKPNAAPIFVVRTTAHKTEPRQTATVHAPEQTRSSEHETLVVGDPKLAGQAQDRR